METIAAVPSGHVTSPRGFSAAAVASGIKKDGALDLALITSDRDSTAAAVFTKNQVAAAPVIIDRETLETNSHAIRGVVANAGNANACTGAPGLKNAREMQRMTAVRLDCRPEQILVLSTGVIGVQLPMKRIRTGIQSASTSLSPAGGRDAAQAIMTTDTVSKHSALRVKLASGDLILGGMAKGAGMIHPNLATMLAVLTTDAVVPLNTLQRLLRRAADASFNRISIDGDTSTNDTVLILANGASGVGVVDPAGEEVFAEALTHICIELAHMIVRDGEGATKFVEIQVGGCRSENEALLIARSIATSPLVKTAFAGSDPNWGRILAAAGRAGAAIDQHKLNLWVGSGRATDLQLVAAGTPTDYEESDAAAVFSQPEFTVRLDVNQGVASTTLWTSDLTHEYIRINASYRS